MGLTSTTTFDLVGLTQTLTFFNPSQVDQITFSSNQITFGAISSFNLVKSDVILYCKYLNTFNNLLIQNFPSVSTSVNNAWPLSEFDITESSSGVTHLIYTQTSQGTAVQTINYVPIATSASFAARGSPVTISLQEFFMYVLMSNQYAIQVNLN
jgi:hypothetical protein